MYVCKPYCSAMVSVTVYRTERKKLLKSISVNDVIQLLTDVKKIRINGQWCLNEINSFIQNMMNKLGINLHNR